MKLTTEYKWRRLRAWLKDRAADAKRQKETGPALNYCYHDAREGAFKAALIVMDAENRRARKRAAPDTKDFIVVRLDDMCGHFQKNVKVTPEEWALLSGNRPGQIDASRLTGKAAKLFNALLDRPDVDRHEQAIIWVP